MHRPRHRLARKVAGHAQSSLCYPPNRDSCHRVPPIPKRGIEVADAVDAGMDVHVAFATTRRAAAARASAFDKKGPRDGRARLVVSFGTGVVRGREYGDRIQAARTSQIVHREKAV